MFFDFSSIARRGQPDEISLPDSHLAPNGLRFGGRPQVAADKRPDRLPAGSNRAKATVR
jgi:hypothetical protein